MTSSPMARCLLTAMLLASIGCTSPEPRSTTADGEPRNEVIVMGTIHAGHLTSDTYGIEDIKRIVRLIEPDYILTEIPPVSLEPAFREFRETGEVTEPRVRMFPEYVDAIFPLTKETEFKMAPCSAWTREMAEARQVLLDEWTITRPEESRKVAAAQEWAAEQLAEKGWDDDPRAIHTAAYDDIVRAGMEPYRRLFNDDLGPGGWDNINMAHMALIDAALDRHRGEGARILITFGAWHKYWFKEALQDRADIVLRNLNDFLPAESRSGG